MTTQQTISPAGRTLLRAAVRFTLPLCALSLMSSPALGYSPDTSRLANTDVSRSVPAQSLGELVSAADPLSPNSHWMQLATQRTYPTPPPTRPLGPIVHVPRTRPTPPPVTRVTPRPTAPRTYPTTPRIPQSPPPAFPGGTRANLPPPVFPIGTRASLPPPVFPIGTRAGLQQIPAQPAIRQFLPVPQRFQQPTPGVQPARVAPAVPQTRRAAIAPAIPQGLRSRAATPAPVATPPAIPSSNPTGAVYSPGSSTGGSNVAQQAAVQQGARSLGQLKRDMDARKAAGK